MTTIEPGLRDVLSVSALNQQVKTVLQRNIPPGWVRGEISNLRRQASGHIYFSLKDEKSQISAVAFRGNAMRLGIELRDGMQVILYGEISVYEPRGTYQLIVRAAIEDGVGRLQLEFERLKKQLTAEGLFDPEQKTEVEAIIGRDIDDQTMWQRAQSVTQEELEADPGNAFLWFNLGTVFSALEDYEKSVVAFDQARALGLPWRMLWYQFGPYESYYRVGRYDDVVILADVTLLDRPYFEESYYYKGLALEGLGEDKEARRNFEEAIRFNPNFEAAQNHINQLVTDS